MITREEALKILKEPDRIGYNVIHANDEETTMYNIKSRMALEMAIKALEQEPKTGHWICTIEDWNKWTCSECGFYKRTDIHVSLGYNYCPNCGVKMESEGTDADSY